MIIKMKAIPESTGSSLEPQFIGPAIKGVGRTSYSCAKCDLVLLENMAPNQIQGVSVRCGRCGTYNLPPFST